MIPASEVPPIMKSRVKKSLNETKNKKALGIDNLASDAMILGGDESVKQTANKFNQILETERYQLNGKKPRL